MDAIDRELIATAIDGLPEDEREIVNALFFERVSYRTLAQRLNCSTTKVIDVRDQALKSLKALIEKSVTDEH
jgi:RNA polymerase sigma factor (sigma-70 family)